MRVFFFAPAIRGSQMAEAILRHAGKGAIEVESAGTLPQPHIHPLARRATRKLLNVEMDGQYPKMLDRFLGQHFDYVITVCDRAAESCPLFPGDPERIHWSLEDPAAAIGTDDEKQRAFDKDGDSTALAHSRLACNTGPWQPPAIGRHRVMRNFGCENVSIRDG